MIIKKALIKSAVRDITGTISRFLSIFGIVFLGVSFFTGLIVTSPDMLKSADAYFDEHKLADFRLVSTYGFDEYDIMPFYLSSQAMGIYPSYFVDALVKGGSGNSAVRIMSLPEKNINEFILTDGRMPAASDECLIIGDRFSNGYETGETLTFISGTDNDLSETLEHREFKIVGRVQSPLYIDGSNLGSTSVGNGTIDAVFYVPQESFNTEYYTEIYISIIGLYDFVCYEDDYAVYAENGRAWLENIAAGREEARYKEIISEGEQKIADAEKELNAAKADAYDEIASAEKELAEARDSLEAARIELAAGKEQLNFAAAQMGEEFVAIMLAEQFEAYDTAFKQYNDGIAEYENGLAELEASKAEAEEEFVKAEAEIDEARTELYDLPMPEWYIFDRTDNSGYSEYGENADRIRNISNVFPVFFVLIAALVCYTTIQRMVEENRLQIGTLKALGYGGRDIIFKYMLYAVTATFTGALAGGLVGMKLFPDIIMSAYGIMYDIPNKEMPYDVPLIIISLIVVILIMAVTVLSACKAELNEQPSQLVRPKTQKKGKRVLIEKIPFIWNRLNFSNKVTIRNLFRYKRRMLMTVIGVSGCTALLLTGFALRDSINGISDKQFGELQTFSGIAVVDKEITAAGTEKISGILKENDTEYLFASQKQYDIIGGGRTVSTYIVVPENTDKFSSFINLRERVGQKPLDINGGAVISEKTAKLLGVKAGDYVTVKKSETAQMSVKITGITENYANNYLYLTKNEYAEIFDEEPAFETLYFKNALTTEENAALSEKLLGEEHVLGVSRISAAAESFASMMTALDMVIYVIIIAAGALAFIVMYNLTNINVNERVREIATLKVLGFYDGEVDRYIFKENMLLAVIGDIAGLVLGVFLARFIIETAEIDIVMFGREIQPLSFVLAAALTMLFSCLVMVFMHGYLKKVDMAGSLKSVE